MNFLLSCNTPPCNSIRFTVYVHECMNRVILVASVEWEIGPMGEKSLAHRLCYSHSCIWDVAYQTYNVNRNSPHSAFRGPSVKYGQTALVTTSRMIDRVHLQFAPLANETVWQSLVHSDQNQEMLFFVGHLCTLIRYSPIAQCVSTC